MFSTPAVHKWNKTQTLYVARIQLSVQNFYVTQHIAVLKFKTIYISKNILRESVLTSTIISKKKIEMKGGKCSKMVGRGMVAAITLKHSAR
jgi:hypothetical protein